MPKSNLPCDKCGSSDAVTEYDDGHSYCYSCKTYFHPGSDMPLTSPNLPSKKTSPNPPLPTGLVANVPQRGLYKPSLGYYGVEVEFSEETGEVSKLWYPVYQKGERTGWKIKNLTDKSFSAVGNVKSPDLFGQKQAGEGGKLLIITEGEEDCMSAHQMLREAGKEYNVVSLPNGANVASVRKNLEWIETFETIILNLDNDDVGRQCAKDIAGVLSPGKTKIMTLPCKDANEFLFSKKGGYLQHLWKAQVYKPDCIISAANAWEQVWKQSQQKSMNYPWTGLNSKLYGMRKREIVTWTAGTGIGKSAVMRELEHWILRHTDTNLGILALEEGLAQTTWGIVAIEHSLPLAIPEERPEESEQQMHEYYDAVFKDNRVHIINDLGVTNEETLLNNVRYMIKGLQCDWVILDHISIVASALNSSVDERRAIDIIMTKLRNLCQETGAGMHLVCHLRRLEGNRSHEQGIEVGLSHLRGSQAIAQLSDAVVAMERNQQADDEKEANLTRLRVLKNRYAGLTGLATNLAYDRKTGRLQEIHNVEEYLAPTIEEAGV